MLGQTGVPGQTSSQVHRSLAWGVCIGSSPNTRSEQFLWVPHIFTEQGHICHMLLLCHLVKINTINTVPQSCSKRDLVADICRFMTVQFCISGNASKPFALQHRAIHSLTVSGALFTIYGAYLVSSDYSASRQLRLSFVAPWNGSKISQPFLWTLLYC